MPPADTLFFPSSAAMAPDGDWLYVANSNADLRFNDGTLVVLNVGEDRTVATDSGLLTLRGAASDRARPSEWAACGQQDYVHPLPRSNPPTCCWDALDSNILNCDERLYVQSDATVRIGSFAAGMVWQPNCTGRRATSACTADPSGGAHSSWACAATPPLTWVDVVPRGPTARTPSCIAGRTAPRDAGRVHAEGHDTTSVLSSQSGDPNAPSVGLPDEPYALALDEPHGLLYVGHLVGNTSVVASGGVSLFDVSETGLPSTAGFPPAPRFVAPFISPFPPNGAGNFGVTARRCTRRWVRRRVAPRSSSSARDTSRRSPRWFRSCRVTRTARLELRAGQRRRSCWAAVTRSNSGTGWIRDARRGHRRSARVVQQDPSQHARSRCNGSRPTSSASTSTATKSAR